MAKLVITKQDREQKSLEEGIAELEEEKRITSDKMKLSKELMRIAKVRKDFSTVHFEYYNYLELYQRHITAIDELDFIYKLDLPLTFSKSELKKL